MQSVNLYFNIHLFIPSWVEGRKPTNSWFDKNKKFIPSWPDHVLHVDVPLYISFTQAQPQQHSCFLKYLLSLLLLYQRSSKCFGERWTGNREVPGSNLDRCTVIFPTTPIILLLRFIYQLNMEWPRSVSL